MKNKLFLILFVCIFLSTLVSAQDLRVSILTPSTTFRVNQSDIITYYVEVINKNDFPITITLSPPERLSHFRFMDVNNFTLDPNESKRVNYDFMAENVGYTSYNIPILFKSDNSSFALSATLNVHVSEDSSPQTQDNQVINSQGGGGSATNKVINTDNSALTVDIAIDASENTTEGINTIDNPLPNESNNSKNNSTRNTFIVIFVLAILCIVIIIIMLKGGKKNETHKKEPGIRNNLNDEHNANSPSGSDNTDSFDRN